MVDRQSSHNDTGRARPLPPPQLHNVTAITRARHSMDVQSRSTTSHHEEDWSWHEAHTPDAPTTPSSPASPQRSQGRVAYASSGGHGNTQLTPRSPRHNRVDSAVSRRPSNSPSRTTSMTEGGGGGASSNRPASLFRSNFLARGGHITASMSTAWTPETAFGRNAISSLLNAPNTKSKSTTSYLTSSWLPMSTGAAGGAALPRPETPPVQPTVIRRVRPEEFQTYLAGIKGPWSDYEHNRGASERIARSLASNTLAEGEHPGLAHPIAEIPPLPAVPLSIIPAVFFEEDFNLSDPETFTATLKLAANVLNREPVVNAIQPDLIDWYSQHLDTVEAHLLREVAMRSSSFFAALAALRNLHSQSTSSVTRTRELRSMLATITRDRVLPILKVIQQSRRRDRLQKLTEAIEAIQDAQKSQQQATEALADGKAREAYRIASKARQRLMALFQTSSSIVTTETSDENTTTTETEDDKAAITDTAVKSDTSKQQQQQQIWIVNYLSKELEQLELSARTAMEDELVRLVTNYLTNICTKAMTFTPDQHGKQQEDHNDMIDRTLPDDLARSMQILAPTTGFTTTTMAALVSSIVTLTNDMFTKSVSPNTSVDQLLTTESLTSVEEFAFTDKVALTQSMQSMTLDAFIELLDTIYGRYSKLLKATVSLYRTATRLLKRNKSTLDGSPPQKLKESTELSSKSNAELEIMAENEPHPLQVLLDQWASLPQSATLAVHVRCTHLIQLRQQHIEQLSAKDFYRLFIPGDTFVRRSCEWSALNLETTPLSNLLKTLAIGFLNTFHTERRRQLATLIAGEQWVPCDVPPEFQQFADAIVSGHGELPTPTTATHNSSSSGSTNVKLESNEEEKDKSTTTATTTTTTAPVSEKQIQVNSHQFYTVGGALLTIKMLCEYLQCAHRIQVASHHVSRAVVDLLRMFNTRVNQMVLGAGAIQSAGLKNITAKHIALASQSLSLMQVLLPYLRINMAELAPRNKATQVMDDFDRLTKEYTEHQDQLKSKLLDIMQDRVVRICQRIESTDWDAPLESSTTSTNTDTDEIDPSRLMMELVKDTITLHKVLSRFYPSEKVQDVLTAVVKGHSSWIEESYGRVTLRTSLGKRRLLADARYFVTRLSALDSVRALGNQLEVAANNIKV